MATPRRSLGLQPAYTPSPGGLFSRTNSTFGTDTLYSPKASPRMAASPRSYPTAGATAHNSPHLSSGLSSTSSRITSAGYIQASDSGISSIQVAFKQQAVENEELARDVTQTQIDSASMAGALTRETKARQELQQMLNLERNERQVLAEEVLKLQHAFKAQATLSASAERRMAELPARMDQLEEELRSCAKESQEKDRVDEFTARMSARLDSCEGLLKNYHQDHKHTSRTLEEVLQDKSDKQKEMTRVQEAFAKQLYDMEGRHKALRGDLQNHANANEAAMEALSKKLNDRCDSLHKRADELLGMLTAQSETNRAEFGAAEKATAALVAAARGYGEAQTKETHTKFSKWCASLEEGVRNAVTKADADISAAARTTEVRLLASLGEERRPRVEREEALATALAKCEAELNSQINAVQQTMYARVLEAEEQLSVVREAWRTDERNLRESVQQAADGASLQVAGLRDDFNGAHRELEAACKAGLLSLTVETKQQLSSLKGTLALQAEDVLAMHGAAEEKVAADLYTMRQELATESASNVGALRELSDKINATVADLKVVERKLPPMESKLSECALKTELKMQLMLMRGQIDEVTDAVPQLSEEQDGLTRQQEALSVRLDKLQEEIAGVSSDIMLLEATANTH